MPRPDPHQRTLSGGQGAMVRSTWFQTGSEPNRATERVESVSSDPYQMRLSDPEIRYPDRFHARMEPSEYPDFSEVGL